MKLISRYGIVFAGVLLIVAIYSTVGWYARIDLTTEKRFSLSPSTRQLLNDLDSTVTIQVFLTGDLPADYKKLSVATAELLDEFKTVSHNHLRVSFVLPDENIKDDSVRAHLFDSLTKLGVVAETAEQIGAKREKKVSQRIIPSALVSFRSNQAPIAIDLRSSRKIFRPFDVINESPQVDIEATRNAAEALLEYKFADAIDKLTRKNVPVVAYLTGNGEPMDYSVSDLVETLRNQYRLGIFDLKKAFPSATQIQCLIVVKPTQPFTDEDKLKLDQYVMQGGKIIWFIDKLHAELDSLMRTKGEYTAFDRGLDLDDLLFKYGVRIRPDLLQDLNCAKLPIVVGKNPDGSPVMRRIPWPYYPFLSARNPHPIVANLDRVLPVFPSGIDTVKSPGIQKTILLSTDSNSRSISSPAIVSLNSVQSDEDFSSFRKSYLPVAVLLEGNFASLFAGRASVALQDSVLRASGVPYAAATRTTNRQIVVSDADIVTNPVSAAMGPQAMGELPFENYRFANRDFFLNALDYLVSERKLYESRNKDFILRLLDKNRVERERFTWQLINIFLPILLLGLIAFAMQQYRKKKYQAPFSEKS
ncbi:MAG: gliding motility-associated ABC transporter substrate-binding protein GldG [Chitinophagia bacterium]|nr:gliding motility-associated ABC transporter substrate-binding protein GldG [Chitinophagia bacterium]